MPAPKRTRSTPEPETAREGARSSTGAPIARQTTMAWWCPFCDHSQTTLLAECGGCGAVRDGDTARAAAA